MPTVLRNAVLFDLDPIGVEVGDLRIENGSITARGRVTTVPGDEIVDCGGAIVMPGLVNGHTHLYSALAVGMPPPPRVPKDFHEILKLIWWRLDRALDAESNETSALIGALDAAHCGTTTLIDHHASPNAIDGSLDHIEAGLARVGLRGVLCYEVTDRNGPDGVRRGLNENKRYVQKTSPRDAQTTGGPRFAGLIGAHASFTLSDRSADDIVAAASDSGVGVHIHVAEDRCDEAHCRETHATSLIDRLARHGLLHPDSIFAHGTHLSPDAINRVDAAGITLAHNARSNMNNAVGYAPIAQLRTPVMLGTDGIGADLFAEAKTAWFKSRDAAAGLFPNDIVAMLANSARRASRSLGVELGKLTPGAAADIVITDYVPFTPIDAPNAAAHLLFALSSRDVRHVMVAGDWVLKDRRVTRVDEPAERASARDVAHRLWRRLPAVPE